MSAPSHSHVGGNPLPEGWAKTFVGDYLYLKNGYAFKSNSYVPAGENTFPVIRISDLDGQDASDIKAVHVESGVQGFEVENGDLLIAMSGATTGKVGVYQGKEPAYQNQRVGNLKLHAEKYGFNQYKNYLILALSDQILKIAYGGAQPNISGKAIEEMDIFLPPLAEQKVIADKLDQLLAQVESTKARLDRIPNILKSFRQSVLAAAVSGKLTEEWRVEKGVSLDTWVPSFIGEVGHVATGKTPKRTEKLYWEGGTIPWLTSSVTGAEYCEKADQFVTEFAVKDCSLKLFPKGSLLLAMYGEGKTRGQVTELRLEAACNQACAVINVNETKALKAYVKLRLLENYEETRKAASGGNQPNLNLNKVREILIAVPELKEQTEIVRRVEQLFAHADKIEQQVQQAQERVNKLTQSILAKAFRGELTEQWRQDNPDLISGENSAEALLAKIKAEREAVKPIKNPRVKKKA